MRAIPWMVPVLATLLAAPVSGPGVPWAGPPAIPDPAHPQRPHDPLFSYEGGAGERPVLVLLLHEGPPSPARLDLARDAVFGSALTSAAGYYEGASLGRLTLVPATDTGVLPVPAASVASITHPFERARAVLAAADPLLAFDRFDRDGDGRVGDGELVVLALDEAGPARSVPAGGDGEGPTHDGVKLESRVNFAPLTGNAMTRIHELGHGLVHLLDLYPTGVETLSLGGATLGLPAETLVGPNAWERLHVGWGQARPASEQTVRLPPAATTGEMLVVPLAETRYVLLENRQALAGTVDAGLPVSGLALWRVDERALETAGPLHEPVVTLHAFLAPGLSTELPDGTSVAVLQARGADLVVHVDGPGPGLAAWADAGLLHVVNTGPETDTVELSGAGPRVLVALAPGEIWTWPVAPRPGTVLVAESLVHPGVGVTLYSESDGGLSPCRAACG